MITDMPEDLRALLQELEQFGKQYDAREPIHERKMRNLEPAPAEFILILIRAARAKRILEIGTSNGYSTLWLAFAAQPLNGRTTTLERAPEKAEMARRNFEHAGLQAGIDLQLTDAGAFLKQQPDAAFDFIFLDSDREEYVSWWGDLQRVLVPGGLMVADNATSHPQELAPFRQLVEQTQGYTTSLVPLGKGELLMLKHP